MTLIRNMGGVNIVKKLRCFGYTILLAVASILLCILLICFTAVLVKCITNLLLASFTSYRISYYNSIFIVISITLIVEIARKVLKKFHTINND